MMTKKDNKNNNLFKWATKELSQDAVLAWLLNMDNIGKGLIKDLCPSLKDEEFEIKNIMTQKDSIDILVDIEFKENNEHTAIIIEDKSDSFLHDCQMLKYISKISNQKQFKNIVFVLFKSGYIFSWEAEEYDWWKELISNKLDKGERVFPKNELNDTIDKGENQLIISGSYQKSDIFFQGSAKILIEKEIYTLEKLKKYIDKNKETIKDNNRTILDYYLVFISQSEDNDKTADENENKNYKKIKGLSNISTKNNDMDSDIKLRMIRPNGPGKRNYDYCFFKSEFFNYTKLSNINNINDNYLLLPFISKKKDYYLFALNYNYIGDLSKQQGYIPYSQLKLTDSQKKNFETYKESVSKFAVDYTKKIQDTTNIKVSEKGKDNRLRVFEFKAKEISEENIKKLLGCADHILKCIRKNEQ